MLNLKHFIYTLFFILVFSGCAKEPPDTLVLDNVMTSRKNEDAMRARAQAAKLGLGEFAPVQQEEDPPTLEEIYEASEFEPKELAFLQFPDEFLLANERLLERGDYDTLIEELGAEEPIVWQHQKYAVKIVAGTFQLDQKRIESQTKSEFVRDLWDIANAIKEYFIIKKDGKAGVTVDDEGEVIFMKVLSKYMQNEQWWSDTRYLFFYTPEYRLTFIIDAPDDEYLLVAKELQESFARFRKDLTEHFDSVF